MSNKKNSNKKSKKSTNPSNNNNNNTNNNNDNQQSQQKKHKQKPKKRTTQISRGRGRGRGRGSALSVPSSKTKRNRQRGLLNKAIQQSFEDDSFPQKRDKLRDLNDAPYNEWNSFYSQSSVDEIFNNINITLKSQDNIDIDIHKSDYKIRGRKFINNISCEFQIEMFKTPSTHNKYPNHILVEFQRRNGDGFVFQSFLSSIMNDLKQTKLITFSKYPYNNNINNGNTSKCWLSPKPIGIHYDNHHINNIHNNDEWDEKQNHDNGINQNPNLNSNPNKNVNNQKVMDLNNKNMDDNTLKILINSLFNGNNCEMSRMASCYLANNISNNMYLINKMILVEPLLLQKFSDLLLKCVDPQIVRSIGFILCTMLQQSNQIKNQAIQLDIKNVCKKVYKRWTEPVVSRYGSNSRHVIRVIPSIQVAQRMESCIAILTM